MDFSELSSHRASQIRRAPAPADSADPEPARYQAPDGPPDGSPVGIATTLRDASSAADIDRAVGELPVLPPGRTRSPARSPTRLCAGRRDLPGAPGDEPVSHPSACGPAEGPLLGPWQRPTLAPEPPRDPGTQPPGDAEITAD